MSLMTGEEYIESIRSLHMEVYMFGKRVEDPVQDPIPVSYTHLVRDYSAGPAARDLHQKTERRAFNLREGSEL